MRTTWERRRQILPQTSEEKQLLAENQELERRLSAARLQPALEVEREACDHINH